jgi:hypothetical protein
MFPTTVSESSRRGQRRRRPVHGREKSDCRAGKASTKTLSTHSLGATSQIPILFMATPDLLARPGY